MNSNMPGNPYPYSWTKLVADFFWLTIILTLLVHMVKALTG